MKWLVTGGAGYIGAHVVVALEDAGQDVVVLDDLSTGLKRRVRGAHFVEGSILDGALVTEVLTEHRVDGVIHLAGKKSVSESLTSPLLYYRENVEGLRTVVEACFAAGVNNFVFSSSAAVYGSVTADWVAEEAVCRPMNPYGYTKLVGERLLADAAESGDFKFAALRYFNVAGAQTPALADVGYDNLVPIVFRKLVNKEAPEIFGGDYETRDGTCIRDYIHVADLASAHVAVASGLISGAIGNLTVNVGRGEGVSVLELVDLARDVTGTTREKWSEPAIRARRMGDPHHVVASTERMRAELGWTAKRDLRAMLESTWAAWVESGQVSAHE